MAIFGNETRNDLCGTCGLFVPCARQGGTGQWLLTDHINPGTGTTCTNALGAASEPETADSLAVSGSGSVGTSLSVGTTLTLGTDVTLSGAASHTVAPAVSTGTTGRSVTLAAGAAKAGSGAGGGTLSLNAGAKDGGGTAGTVDIGASNTSAINMGCAVAMGTAKITGLGDPTADQDAATRKYVVDSIAAIPPSGGGPAFTAVAAYTGDTVLVAGDMNKVIVLNAA